LSIKSGIPSLSESIPLTSPLLSGSTTDIVKPFLPSSKSATASLSESKSLWLKIPSLSKSGGERGELSTLSARPFILLSINESMRESAFISP